ncbi:hypothetical protein [Crocosphaera sp.]|nr:hypothetical protein [Crocosphaera sp.]MDJ0581132.1 hypothetical protein [Crocosphaera sp.]
MKFPEIDRNLAQGQLALQNWEKLPDIESACLAFNVMVTGEEVENV